jgi:hypothetical protein
MQKESPNPAFVGVVEDAVEEGGVEGVAEVL